MPGVQLFMQPAQDINVGGRLSRTLYQYTLQDADIAELNTWAPQDAAAHAERCRNLRDVATDQQIAGTTATMTIDRSAAQRFGIEPQQIDDTLYDAFGQREVTQYFTQLNSYFVILEVPPQLEGDLATLRKLYVRAPNGSGGAAVGAGARRHQADHAAGSEPPEPVPGGDDLVQPGPRRRRSATRSPRSTRSATTLRAPLSLQGSFQGSAQAFQTSLGSEPYLIAAALTAVYIILGVLYESYILPLTILSTLAIGWRRRAADADAGALRPVGDRDDRHHPADRHREEERHHDGGFRHPCRASRGHGAGRGHPPGVPAAVSADPDDDDGGAAVGPAADAGERRRSELRKPLGYAMVGGLMLSQIAHAVHDAGHLSLS